MRLFIRKIFTAISLFFNYLSKITYRSEQEKQVDMFFKDNGDMTLRLDYDLDESSIIFDMGGFVGRWASDLFSKYRCEIHIFEPVPEFADGIRKRFSANPKITLHPFGLSDSTEQVSIKLDKEGSSAYKKGGENTTINLVCAEEFLKQNSIAHIDLMKINIEGGEYDLLTHLIATGFIKNINELQIQFHNFVPKAKERMRAIQDKLGETHYTTYQYPFVWENWRRKTVTRQDGITLNRNPIISIITACHNSESCIENCIQSVLQQTYSDIEYIIIDGNSTDNTCDIIKKYSDDIDFFVSEPDSGIYSAFNKGIENATGDYVLFLNSDDTLFDDKVIEDVANFIAANDNPAAVYGKVNGFESSTGYTYLGGKPTKLSDFIFKMHYCASAAFVDRSIFKRVGLYSEKYKIASDYDWAIRLFKECPDNRLIFYDRIICNFSVDGCSNKNYYLAFQEVSLIVKGYFGRADFFKHIIYIKLLLLMKTILPVFRFLGILTLWRKFKKLREL